MTTRTFAAWVEPVAAALRKDHEEVLAFVRTVPEDAWSTPSPLEGWSCKDVLAHIGKANDLMFQDVLRHVIAGEHMSRELFAPETERENRERVAERRDWPAANVIAEVEEAGDEVQDLLSQLSEEHERYTQDDPPFALAGFLNLVDKERHSIEHLAQLRQALETPG